MTDVLDTIEWELLTAIRRSNARRRRRRRLGFFGGAIFGLTVATAGVGAIGQGALDDVLNGNDAPSAGISAVPGAPRATLSLDDAGGNRWSLSLHRTDGGTIVLSALPDDLPRGPGNYVAVNGYSPLVLIAELQHGPVALAGPLLAERDGDVTRMVVGEVDDEARAVTVEVDGRRYPAQLTEQALEVDVPRPDPAGLTPEGRAMIDRLGGELRLRGFAVALPDDAIPAGVDRVVGTTETELADGTTVSEPLRLGCVVPACGATVYKLPDQDG